MSLPWPTFGSWENTLFSEQQFLSYNEAKDRMRGGSCLIALDLLTYEVLLDKRTGDNLPLSSHSWELQPMIRIGVRGKGKTGFSSGKSEHLRAFSSPNITQESGEPVTSHALPILSFVSG